MIKLNELNKQQKIIIITVISAFVLLFTLLIFLQPSNPYGEFVGINNYNEYLPSLPKDSQYASNNQLRNIVKVNNPSIDIKSINDASIRDGSSVDNYDKDDNMHYGSFIIDIKSIKQSYLASYYWSNNPDNPNNTKYSGTIKCLPVKDLIYGGFNCKDDFNNSITKENIDPIMDFLPYDTLHIRVTANSNIKGKVSLNATIILSLADTRNDQTENSVNKYKNQINTWIISSGLSPNDYPITYTIEQ